MTTIETDICVIGAGSGGLSVAAAAAQLGTKVVLIEKGKMGGDCLNYGCVPSKAIIAAGKRAHVFRSSAPFGITPVEPEINYRAVHDHIHAVIGAIEPNDSVERFTGLGVHVIQAHGVFKDRDTVVAGDHEIKARRFVIATGSTAGVPPIPGLSDVPYFTNESLFENDQKIEHLIVIGGGPIGMEMAQAHRRLGSRVTVLEAFRAFGKDDPELAEVVLKQLRAEGIEILEGIAIERMARGATGGVVAHIKKDGVASEIVGSHVLVAAGRKPNVDGLGLDKAGITFDKRGITVDSGMRTTNSRVYAIGDVAGSFQFTHVANYHAGIVIRRALFRIPAKVRDDIIPWVTYTEPELAHVGLTEAQARERHGEIRVLRWPYHENDRSQAERDTHGFVKVVTNKGGRILGADIVGPHAGELIQMWGLAITQGMKIKAFTAMISPYPTLSEINKRAAYVYYLPSLSSQKLRRLIAFLRRFG